jgi:hypothetical protein
MGRKPKITLVEPKYATSPPTACSKPDCKGMFFIPHDDGWQCWNCMKIVYRDQSILSNMLNSKESDTL